MARRSTSLATRHMQIQTTLRSAPVIQHEWQTKRMHALERMGKSDHMAGGIGKGTGIREDMGGGFWKPKLRSVISKGTNGEKQIHTHTRTRIFHSSPVYNSLKKRWSRKSFHSMIVQLRTERYMHQRNVEWASSFLWALHSCIPPNVDWICRWAYKVAYRLNFYRFFPDNKVLLA